MNIANLRVLIFCALLTGCSKKSLIAGPYSELIQKLDSVEVAAKSGAPVEDMQEFLLSAKTELLLAKPNHWESWQMTMDESLAVWSSIQQRRDNAEKTGMADPLTEQNARGKALRDLLVVSCERISLSAHDWIDDLQKTTPH